MKTKQITIFETLDGKQFDKKDDAKQHEIDLVINNFSEKEIALMLKNMCKERAGCVGCPFHRENNKCAITYTPDAWFV